MPIFSKEKSPLQQGLDVLETAPTIGRIMIRDPLDPEPLKTDFSKYEVIIQNMAAEVEAIVVTDAQSSAKCAEMAAQTRKISNEIEKERKAKVAPYNVVVKSINDFCRPFAGRLTSFQKVLENKNKSYLIAEDIKRREALRKAEEEAERQRKEAEAKAKAEAEDKAKELNIPVEEVHVEPVVQQAVYIPPAKTTISTESGTTKVEYDMVWEISDFKALPDACLSERAEQIKAAVTPWINARVKAGITNDSGIIYRKEARVKTRAGR